MTLGNLELQQYVINTKDDISLRNCGQLHSLLFKYVPYPDDNDRVKLCTMYCKNKSPDSQCTPEVLSNLFKGFSCARIETVLNKAALISVQKGKKDFSLLDVNEAIKSV